MTLDRWSVWVVVIAVICVAAGYLPTLQADFVVPDQWRAFRYSASAGTALERADACRDMVSGFYVSTGRPLVAAGECIEHAVVGRIADFSLLRPLVLLLVLFSVLYLGLLLSSMPGGWAGGATAAALFVVAPGYAFIYFQGMTGAPLLLCVLLAAGSFSLLSKGLDEIREPRAHALAEALAVPFVLFVAACMIYPAWAFVVVPLAWLHSVFDGSRPVERRLSRFAAALTFYVFAALLYYVIVKLMIAQNFLGAQRFRDLGPYTMSMNLDAAALWDRLVLAAGFFATLPLFNARTLGAGFAPLLLLAFSAYAGYRLSGGRSAGTLRILAATGGALACSVVLLAGSIAPWLFSNMDSLAERHVLPWYLFLAASAVAITVSLLSRTGGFAVACVLTAMLSLAGLAQHRLSLLETTVSRVEIDAIRAAIDRWIVAKGYVDPRHILVVRPRHERPKAIGPAFDNAVVPGQNLVLSSSQHPEHIQQMLHAVLRERSDHPVGRSLEFWDCRFDRECAERNLFRKSRVVLVQVRADDAGPHRGGSAFVIDLSEL
jgi:hypothetical protein